MGILKIKIIAFECMHVSLLIYIFQLEDVRQAAETVAIQNAKLVSLRLVVISFPDKNFKLVQKYMLLAI